MNDGDGYLMSGGFVKKLRSLTERSSKLLRPAYETRFSSAPNAFEDYPLSWKNTESGETCPPYGIFAVDPTGPIVVEGGLETVYGKRPSDTFNRIYYVNGPYEVPYDSYGTYQAIGSMRMAYGDGTPATGMSYGPKPGSWLLWQNYPSICDVAGIYDATDKILKGTWHPINSLIGKIDGAFNSAGNTVKIWSGAAGGEAVVTSWTVAGEYWQDSPSVDTDGKVQGHFKNGIWYIHPLGGSGGASIWYGTASGAISKGASGTCSLDENFDGTPETNRTCHSYLGAVGSGDKIYVVKLGSVYHIIAAECA